ncbi:uncharacterized protein CC84DRAFT_1103107 [Paraphaeosphaeria sporulosa]|uniref:Uncharacterized protein n=1 Tax=Paraphaeosphaeria sporulosa TaxID=1460663 RepID=A0A177C0S9_9PLEO|nr:uncharacterized protein CC84DRAFT_1103107 [Paraphaeosphaeria sporulosa]OAG00220.1 hypothetical protein CC84DRAFT_1103107 [Paraphaeosphaeria sporulosa]
MPAVISSKSSSGSRKERNVGFMRDPVSAVSRPVNTEESWAAHHFETHAQKCAYCRNPYEVHRNHEQLCEIGHRLAQDVASFLYQRADGKTYSTVEEENKLVQIEIPSGYTQVRSLLKAIERSLRHRTRAPFVSMDRTYYVAARMPVRSHSVKVDQEIKHKSRPRSGEIVDWPSSPKTQKVTVEVDNSSSKRGSLYEQDLELQRRNAKNYKIEVREPSPRDRREHRLSGYYR